ncbi:MAG TPA: hypothetical protein VMI94_23820 [Bryobacteraceae bacterium]|nr:hypothetical protein [Bryobacteraceae bacterium]
MPTFEFRLRRVLEWYQTQCRLEENRLTLCLGALSHIQERIARFRADNLRIEREVMSSALIAAHDLAALGFYRLRAKIQAAEMEHEESRRQTDVKDQMAVVRAAQRRLRLVEKLRERQLAEHLYVEDRALENLAAENYLSKWTAASRRAHSAGAPASRAGN